MEEEKNKKIKRQDLSIIDKCCRALAVSSFLSSNVGSDINSKCAHY